MEKKPVITFENFSFQYFSQAEPTLHDINLTIYEGEKVLLVGPSGSGKSTLGHCINGLIPFSYRGEMKGSVKVAGLETREGNLFELSKKVGTVLQDSDGQFIGLTVGEDIAFSLENDCVEEKEMKETVQKVADMVDMGKLLKSSPFELSGGQKQRVAFAGVMVDDVDVLLFDEPLANLDPATGKTAIDLIDRIQKQSQKTVVIIEHRLEDVLYRHVDRIVVVAEGRIVADMTPDELMATQQLSELGIREPLYVTAMKYAGISITPQMRAGQLQTLVIDDEIRRKIQAWCEKPVPTGRPAGEEILAVKHLSFQYTKSRKILQDVNFSIKSGEMVSIVGTNGAGKSTLAKVICGFVTEDAGEILFEGKSLKGQTIKERSQYISYVMQNPNQMICKPMIFDEVALGLRIRGELSEEEIRERVEHALKICGLYPFRKWPVSALSFGQKKRVTIASMLVMNPKVLILDEPTAGQDYRHYTEIMEFLKELNQQGVTIILITHDMHLMLEYTPHAIVINGGKKIGDSTAVDILTNEEIANAASLKLTSLYEFGLKLGLKDPQGLVQHFIDYEREVCRE
ncbi:MAG: ABC transporter ATP-binding protein [Oscillospiraceae bacterium]